MPMPLTTLLRIFLSCVILLTHHVPAFADWSDRHAYASPNNNLNFTPLYTSPFT
jgi:hypothetical protein